MFHDPGRFPFVAALESEWEATRDEFRRARPRFEDRVERKLYDQGWQVLMVDFVPE